MLKKYILLISFACCSLLLTSCSDIDQNVVSESADKYFNTSEIEYAGKTEQKIASGYRFEDAANDEPCITYDLYISPNNEEFCYDEQHRLCKYKNSDDIFLGKKTSDPDKYLSDGEVEELCFEIAKYYLGDDYKFETEFNDETGELYVSGINKTDSDFTNAAVVKVNRAGDICYISLSYNTLTQPIGSENKAYFQNKIDEYIKEHDVDSSEYTVKYEQIGSELYALYDCVFTEDEATFCEQVVFSKNLSES